MDAEVRRVAVSARIAAKAALRSNRIVVQELTGLIKQLDRVLDAEPKEAERRNGYQDTQRVEV